MSIHLFTTPFIEAADEVLTLKAAFAPGVRNLSSEGFDRLVVMKLLLAVAHAALRDCLRTKADRARITSEDLRTSVLDYLTQAEPQFDLEGDSPFLQVNEARRASTLPAASFLPGGISGNTPLFKSTSHQLSLSDAEKIMIVLHAVIAPLGGKKFDRKFHLDPSDSTVVKSAPPAPSVGLTGYLHTFILGETLADTLRLNLLSEEELKSREQFSGGIGIPPWEKQPDDAYKYTLMGRLLPMLRFVLLNGGELHIGFGMPALPLSEGAADPSVTVWPDSSKKMGWAVIGLAGPTPLWKRCLLALGGLFPTKDQPQFSWDGPKPFILDDATRTEDPHFRGFDFCGVQLTTFQTGDQYFADTDRQRVMRVWLSDGWRSSLAENASFLEAVSQRLYAAVNGQLTGLGLSSASDIASAALKRFQNDMESLQAQILSTSEGEVRIHLRKRYAQAAMSFFHRLMPSLSSRIPTEKALGHEPYLKDLFEEPQP